MKTWNKNLPLCLVLLPASSVWAAINEAVPPNEAVATQQIVSMIEKSVRAEAGNGSSAHRDAHAKAHGCVRAEFSVTPKQAPEELRVGIFAEARTYPAWIRFSNASGKVQDDDSVGDARGMAVKLIGVERSTSGTQDFLMINHPVFLVRNAADYVEFQQALSEDNSVKFFFPGLNPFNFRLHELGIANAIRSTKAVNPLNSRYWSTTPYLLGNTAMKFSARPCVASPFVEDASPNFLRENMQKQLAQGQACFDFMIQRQSRPSEMPIEDPTIEWSEKDSPFIPVARITIPTQAFDTPEQSAFCENLSFTPWHALPAHQPLGGINRVRKTVYETISRLRHELNGDKRSEPRGAF